LGSGGAPDLLFLQTFHRKKKPLISRFASLKTVFKKSMNFILIALSLLAGLAFRNSKTLPADSYKAINAWVLYIALPAVSLKYIPSLTWTTQMLLPAASPIIVWMGGWLTVTLYSAIRPLSPGTKGSLKLSSGLSNTAFLGFPLIAAYYSEKEISIAIICDQLTFITLSTIGMIAAIRASESEELSIKNVLKKLYTFPPLIVFILALVLPNFIDISPINPLLDKLIATMGPLALFSIGLQLNFNDWKAELQPMLVGLFYKLLLAPALVTGIALLLKQQGMIAKISVFEAAMPTLVVGSLVATQYNLNPKLANLMVGIGILLSFITTAFWWFVMENYIPF
jgi:predicted permease